MSYYQSVLPFVAEVLSLLLVLLLFWRLVVYFSSSLYPKKVRRILLENLTETGDGYWFLDVYVDGVHQYLFVDPNYENQWRSMPSGTVLTDTFIITAANDLIVAYKAKKKGESSAYRSMFDSAPESASHAIVKRGRE